jgi:hypothetical protein
VKEINIINPGVNAYKRILALGAPRSGKTHFAASAPAPLFIGDNSEGGFETIQYMDPKLWWDPSVPPEVRAIEDAFADLHPELLRLEKLKAEGKFPYRTIVIDPISIYADRVMSEMVYQAAKAGKERDGRQMFGDLANHLRLLLLRVHALPAHVIWLCHVKEGGLSLAGQMSDKLPAFMNLTVLLTKTATIGTEPKFEMHTEAFGAFAQLGARARFVNSAGQYFGLPSPMIPSFKALAQIYKLGTPVSPSMPGHPNGAKYTWPPEPQAQTQEVSNA